MILQPHIVPSSIANLTSNVVPNDILRRHTILLVEDEPFVREATSSILQHAGFEVLPAIDAQSAVRVFAERSRDIDLLMTDMILPGRTGQQLGNELRLKSPEIAILITSGYSSLDDDMEAPQLHTYFLAKPYSRRTLLDKIERILATPTLAHTAIQAR
jgi:DNA-binding NtrC family response regulator